MPYKSHSQRRFFNANRRKLESQGVDVDEWNKESKGKKMPKKVKKKAADPRLKAQLQSLLEAKAASDKRDYSRKYAILQGLINERPDEFQVDSRERNIVGLTHTPTGFRMHLPSRVVPSLEAKQAAMGVLLVAAMRKTAGDGTDLLLGLRCQVKHAAAGDIMDKLKELASQVANKSKEYGGTAGKYLQDNVVTPATNAVSGAVTRAEVGRRTDDLKQYLYKLMQSSGGRAMLGGAAGAGLGGLAGLYSESNRPSRQRRWLGGLLTGAAAGGLAGAGGTYAADQLGLLNSAGAGAGLSSGGSGTAVERAKQLQKELSRLENPTLREQASGAVSDALSSAPVVGGALGAAGAGGIREAVRFSKDYRRPPAGSVNHGLLQPAGVRYLQTGKFRDALAKELAKIDPSLQSESFNPAVQRAFYTGRPNHKPLLQYSILEKSTSPAQRAAVMSNLDAAGRAARGPVTLRKRLVAPTLGGIAGAAVPMLAQKLYNATFGE